MSTDRTVEVSASDLELVLDAAWTPEGVTIREMGPLIYAWHRLRDSLDSKEAK